MENENPYKLIFLQAQDAMILENETGEIMDANVAACLLFGYSYREILRMKMAQMIIVPESGLTPLHTSGSTIEVIGKHHDGQVIPLETTVTLVKIGKKTLRLSVIRDITERKRAEKVLNHQSHILNILMDQMEDMVYYKDKNFKYIFANNSHCRKILKNSQKACIGKTDDQVAPLTKHAVYIDGMGETLINSDKETKDRGKPCTFTEIVMVDGQKMYMEVSKTPLYDEEGNFSGIVASSRDITERKLAEQKMAEQQSLLRCLVDSIPASVYLKDRDLKYQAVNKAFADFIGKNMNEIPEKTDSDFFPKQEAKLYRESDRKIMETGEPVENLEEPIVESDGTQKWVMTTKVPYRDGEDKIVGMVGISLDITERKLAEEALTRRDEILQAVAFAAECFLKTPNWNDKVQEVLERLGKASGATRVNIFKNAVDIKGKLLMTRHCEWEKSLDECSQNALKFKKLCYRDAGFTRWETSMNQGNTIYGDVKSFPPKERKILSLQGIHSIAVVPIFSGSDWWGFIGFDECIQERKWFQAEIDILKAAADILGAAIQRKHQEDLLRHAKEDAERANRSKSHFLANVSHEIRTPMNAIINLTDLVLKTELNTRQQNHLNKVSSSARALLRILNDILDFTKIEAGKMEVEKTTFQLQDILEDIADLFGYQTYLKGIEMLVFHDTDVPGALIGDPLRIKQILINLLGNAIKFTEAGEIIIQVSCIEQDQTTARLCFSVKDSGIGISPEQIRSLFSAFTQGDGSTTRKYGGTGLGLAISKRLVTLMDGDIHVESEPGKGSTFTVNIQFDRQPLENEYQYNREDLFQGRNVLIVDDHLVNRTMLKEVTESFGFDVEIAVSGNDALTILENSLSETMPYDLILMDSSMPERSGIETAKQIRSNPTLARIPIVLMSPFGSEREMKIGESIGIEDYLFKPIKKSTLFNILVEVLSRESEPLLHTPALPMKKIKIQREIQEIKILLVEDIQINRDVAEALLKNTGIHTDMAVNGKIAVEMVKNYPYDAVLMDIQMPEMDGYEATQAIRAYEAAQPVGNPIGRKRIPIIAMTAFIMKGEQNKCFEAGMDEYITKPLKVDNLFEVLEKCVPGWERPSEYHNQECICETTETKLTSIRLEELSGIDVHEGLQRIQGNQKLFIRLLTQFCKNQGNVVTQIRSALSQNKISQARLSIHSFKGLAGNLSANDLQAIALELEDILDGGNQEQIEKGLLDLERKLKKLINSVHELQEEADTSREKYETQKTVSSVPIDVAEIKPKLIELFSLLSEHNIESEYFFENMKNLLNQDDIEEQSRKLEMQIGGYDFKDAQNTLQQIANVLGISLQGGKPNGRWQ